MKSTFARLAVSTVLVTQLSAHQDPTILADSLTHQIEHFQKDNQGHDLDEKKTSQIARLYMQRAVEYSAINERKKAHVDLEKYTELSPNDYMGWLKLARHESDVTKQSRFLQKSLELADTDTEQSYVYFDLAEYAYEIGNYQNALEHCNLSLSLIEGDQITTTLFKAHLLWRLGKLDQRVAYLEEVIAGNSSFVLKRAWVDAKLDAGQAADVKQTILEEIASSRFKSSWLIRAARSEKKGSEQAQKYAQSAIDEILPRLNPSRPDETLQIDLVRAYSLLDDKESNKKAQQYFHQVKEEEYNRCELAELKALINKKTD